jgi:hypothetical protein
MLYDCQFVSVSDTGCSRSNVVWLFYENQAETAKLYVSKLICIYIFQINFFDLLDIRYNKVLRWRSSFGSVHQVMLKCCHVLEKQNASIFTVDWWFWVVAEVIPRNLFFCSKQGMRQFGESLLSCAENLQDYSEPVEVMILIIIIIWECEKCVDRECCRISICCSVTMGGGGGDWQCDLSFLNYVVIVTVFVRALQFCKNRVNSVLL